MKRCVRAYKVKIQQFVGYVVRRAQSASGGLVRVRCWAVLWGSGIEEL